MKKIIKILSIIIFIIIIFFYIIFRILRGPNVGITEKRNVSNIVEKYLTEKYGDHNFKVYGVDYDYHSSYIFDYSNKVGYLVKYKSDVLKSAVSVQGIYPNISSVSDWLLEDYYFKDELGLAGFEEMKKLAPKGEIVEVILNKIRNEYDINIQNIKIGYAHFKTPDDFGRIPTIDEIENNIKLYWVSGISYTTTIELDKKEEYEIKLKEYLSKSFGGEWDVYFTKKDNYYYISCHGDEFNIGDILNN